MRSFNGGQFAFVRFQERSVTADAFLLSMFQGVRLDNIENSTEDRFSDGTRGAGTELDRLEPFLSVLSTLLLFE